MLNELKDLAQKKSKAEKAVQDYIKKKEEERIRKSVRSDKLEEFFEPVTKAVEKITLSTAVGQLVPVPNVMDLPVPPEPLAIEDPDDPDDPNEPDDPDDLDFPVPSEPFVMDDPDEPQLGPSGETPSGPQIVEMQPGGVNITRFDAEEQLEGADMTN